MFRSEITTHHSLAGPVTRSLHQQAVAGGLDDAPHARRSIGSRRSVLRRAKVLASSCPISRLYIPRHRPRGWPRAGVRPLSTQGALPWIARMERRAPEASLPSDVRPIDNRSARAHTPCSGNLDCRLRRAGVAVTADHRPVEPRMATSPGGALVAILQRRGLDWRPRTGRPRRAFVLA